MVAYRDIAMACFTFNAMLCCCSNSIPSDDLSQLMHISKQIPLQLHSHMCILATLFTDWNCGQYSELLPQVCKPSCDGLQAAGTVMCPPTTYPIVQLRLRMLLRGVLISTAHGQCVAAGQACSSAPDLA